MIEIARPRICTRCARSLAVRTNLVPRTRTQYFNVQERSYSVHRAKHGRPFRMAVIGSGPAGFYTSLKVISNIQDSVVDMYEQLPVPFGLVRFGVAPDHPEVKNCQVRFTEVAESPQFNFIGNIAIGNSEGELPLKSLLPHYDAICFAYGASKDRKLNIPGEDTLKGIYSARAFVGWYNGLPEYSDLVPDLTVGEETVIIGQGNVALDVARILLRDIDSLRSTDITENAIETLKKSRIKRVRVVGRRGVVQTALTNKELREMIKLPSAAFHPLKFPSIPTNMMQTVPRALTRMRDIIRKGGVVPLEAATKSWSLDFLSSPKSFNARPDSPNQLGSMSFERTSLIPDEFDPNAKAVGTGEIYDIPADLAFRSIGYKSEALPGLEDLGIHFNNNLGIIPNDALGGVTDDSDHPDGRVNSEAKRLPGIYCAGWVKRGPTGVIASTMEDAFSTAFSITEDWSTNGKVPFLNGGKGSGLGWEGVKETAEKRGCRRVSWDDWKKIDDVEKKNGENRGKEREKFTKIDEMLAVLD